MTKSELLFGAWAFDRCGCCMRLFSYELRRSCADCAGATCPSCAAFVDSKWVCATCRAAAAAPPPPQPEQRSPLQGAESK